MWLEHETRNAIEQTLRTSAANALKRPEDDQLDHGPGERTCEGEDEEHGEGEEHDDFSSEDV